MLDEVHPIDTIVPGQDAVSLVAYDPRFASYYPQCELQTKRWMCETIQSDWCCIDAGANVGYYSVLMARLAPDGHVYAFEPTSTVEMLAENLRANLASTDNISIFQIGLGARSFSGRESVYQTWGEPPVEIEGEFTTIDDFVEQHQLSRVDLIKIDVDGFDLEVLWGAERTLSRFSPVVVVELNHALTTRGHSVTDALDWMLAQRYGDALVLDKENFAFRKTSTLGEPWPRELLLSFDKRDPVRPFSPRLSPTSSSSVEYQLNVHENNGACLGTDGIVTIDAPAWSYAVDMLVLEDEQPSQALEVTVEILEGSAGVFLAGSEELQVSGEEIVGNASAGGRKTFTFPIDSPRKRRIVIRKTTAETLRFRIQELSTGELEFESRKTELLNRLGREALGHLTGLDPDPSWEEIPLNAVSAVTAQELGAILGVAERPPTKTKHRDPGDLIMERDDAPLLGWLYRSLAPAKHFEFGTWEGFGTTLCLKNSDAAVWTVNLPGGEGQEEAGYPYSREPKHPDNPFGNADGSSDSGTSIGWMYRAEALAQRVTQLMADSKDLDLPGLPAGDFDSVFIDGGHDRETVRSDQELARQLAGPAGAIIWHDFTLDPDVAEALPSTQGVITAVADATGSLSERYELHWVEGTLLLIAIPKT